jgi:hypothetical protein
MIATVLASNPDAGQTALDYFLFIWLIVAYWVPTIVAWRRNIRGFGQVVVVNFFLGWTFVGWVIALAMAYRQDRK